MNTIRKAVMLDTPRRTANKAKPAPSAQDIADETAQRLRNAAKPADTAARVRNMPASDLAQFVGGRIQRSLETLKRPRLEGLDSYSGDQKLDEKAARISKVARDPHALPADRMEARTWLHKFNENNTKVAALKAAGRFMADLEEAR